MLLENMALQSPNDEHFSTCDEQLQNKSAEVLFHISLRAARKTQLGLLP